MSTARLLLSVFFAPPITPGWLCTRICRTSQPRGYRALAKAVESRNLGWNSVLVFVMAFWYSAPGGKVVAITRLTDRLLRRKISRGAGTIPGTRGLGSVKWTRSMAADGV